MKRIYDKGCILMKEYSTWNEDLRIKLYDDGRQIGTIEVTFDDYNGSYEVRQIHGKNYDYYEGMDRDGDIEY